MSIVINEYPDWVEKYRKKGVTIRKRGNNTYGLYKCTSIYVPGKKYPKSVQKFLGMVYEDKGFVPKGIKIKESPAYLEYGLSSFIMANFKRQLEKAAYDRNINIVKLGIIYYIFSSYDEKILRRSFLTFDDEELIEYAMKISDKRIKTIALKIGSLLKEKLPDEKERMILIGLLKLTVKDANLRIEPEICEDIVHICERRNLKLWR